jgi:hypothetical protein
MSDNNGKGKIIGQIVAAVVIALLVGGTSPWWWDKIFPEKGSTPQSPHVTPRPPDVTPKPPQVATPESLSQTAYSLPGDAIVYFRITEIQGRKLTVDVDYRYNEQHGQKVMVGAWLKGVSSGYAPIFLPSMQQGTARLQMSVNEPGTSTDIDIFLYEYGRPAEPFARRVFPYQMRFE